MTNLPPVHNIPKNLALSDNLISEAADRFGTPLYIYDENMLQVRWKELRSIIPKALCIYYSVKANPNIHIIKVFKEMGAQFEVASLGELLATKQAGVKSEDIIFVGPGKTDIEIEEAIHFELQAIIAESKEEVEKIQVISQAVNKKISVALRINPGHGSGTIQMGGETQFGMDLSTAQAIIERKYLRKLEIIGLHCYFGTGILDWKQVLDNCKSVLRIADKLQRDTGKKLSFIDMGGGFGIPYYTQDEIPDWHKLASPLANIVDGYISHHPWSTRLGVESGRFLTGPAGIFVSRVLYVKKSGNKTYAILDGGSNVFGYDRYYGARSFPLRVLGRDGSGTEEITICGPLCTSMDRLAADVSIPSVCPGDIIVFYLAGAYGLTASPTLFLSHGHPCEVLVNENEIKLIRKRTKLDQITFDQMCNNKEDKKRGDL